MCEQPIAVEHQLGDRGVVAERLAQRLEGRGIAGRIEQIELRPLAGRIFGVQHLAGGIEDDVAVAGGIGSALDADFPLDHGVARPGIGLCQVDAGDPAARQFELPARTALLQLGQQSPVDIAHRELAELLVAGHLDVGHVVHDEVAVDAVEPRRIAAEPLGMVGVGGDEADRMRVDVDRPDDRALADRVGDHGDRGVEILAAGEVIERLRPPRAVEIGVRDAARHIGEDRRPLAAAADLDIPLGWTVRRLRDQMKLALEGSTARRCAGIFERRPLDRDGDQRVDDRHIRRLQLEQIGVEVGVDQVELDRARPRHFFGIEHARHPAGGEVIRPGVDMLWRGGVLQLDGKLEGVDVEAQRLGRVPRFFEDLLERRLRLALIEKTRVVAGESGERRHQRRDENQAAAGYSNVQRIPLCPPKGGPAHRKVRPSRRAGSYPIRPI